MNKFLIFYVLIFLICSCKKEDDLPPLNRPYWGEISASTNSEVWNPRIIGLENPLWPNVYGLEIDTYDDKNIIRSSLSIFGLPLDSIGVFHITKRFAQDTKDGSISALYVTVVGDGDAIGDLYMLLDTENNVIKIEEFREGIIKGEFNISLVRVTSVPRYLEKTDTIRFTQGRFHTRIVKAK